MNKKIFAIFLLWLIGSCKTVSNEKSTGQLHENFLENFVVEEIFATANLEPKPGFKAKGKAYFSRNRHGIQIFILVTDASPGFHGIHIHEIGDCSSKDSHSAGGHFNPTNLEHGPPNPNKYHVGDLGNIVIANNNQGILSLAIPVSQLHPAFPDWHDLIGKALVLHSDPDDLISQPSGNSGQRIACGVIEKIY
jgi:superoxide dismutase, Cu-Zn family